MLQPGNSVNGRPRLLLAGLIAVAFAVFAILFAVLPSPARSANPYTVTSDIPYGPANDQSGSNLLDIYVPNADSDGPRPVFV